MGHPSFQTMQSDDTRNCYEVRKNCMVNIQNLTQSCQSMEEKKCGKLRIYSIIISTFIKEYYSFKT